MNKTKTRAGEKILRACLCLAAGAILIVPLYLTALFHGKLLNIVFLLLAVVLTAAILYVINMIKARQLAAMGLILCAAWAILVFLCTHSYTQMKVKMQYISPPQTKSELFSGKKVLLLVPHQDDEINVLGGVIEEYAAYSSDITVVYSTNGDYYDIGPTRMSEAVAVLGQLGVPEENIIFMGYGDEWQNTHIYNSPLDQIKTSHAGYTKTYGSKEHSAYTEGRDYTKRNFLQDLKNIILLEKPDVIYCVDYDYNKDHRALSLSFEKVLGEILKEQQDYAPEVYKGFAYSTAWYGKMDFSDSINLSSTKNIYDSEYMQENNIYLWEDRVRLPVSPSSLSRTLEFSKLYQAIAGHASQNATDNAKGIINGDKVFWQRETGSMLYNAEISASSGDAHLLNDFMLLDCSAIESDLMPFEGTWKPEEGDVEKRISVKLSQAQNIKRLCLYDNPDINCNIKDIKIVFDDGSEMRSGPLAANGSATSLNVNKAGVRSFEICIEDYEGKTPGLTEIEAFGAEKRGPELIKLTTREGDFLYDCVLCEETMDLALYSSLEGISLESPGVKISCDNEKIIFELKDGYIRLSCPEKERAMLTVEDEKTGLSDTIIVRRADSLEFVGSGLAEHVYSCHMGLLALQRENHGAIMDRSLWGSLMYAGKLAVMKSI